MTLEIRAITEAEIPAFREAAMVTFGTDADADQGGAQQHRELIAAGRSWAAFDGLTIVGTAATLDFQIGVPGGNSLAMAGLTIVTVRPSHRRRGILRELIRHHLDDAHDRRVPVSGLWASEAAIYQRFGYGLASHAEVYEIANAHTLPVAAGRPLDDLEWIDEARGRELLPAIYERATRTRPGALRRSDAWWRERRFSEAPRHRAGASRLRLVLARRGSEHVGYIVYRQRAKFTDGIPDGRLEITELFGIDARAEATLWRFALSVDLFPTVTLWNAPADGSLPWLVPDIRRVKRQRTDNLWLRIADIPAALTARSYESDGTLRFAVDDQSWELSVRDGRGACTATTQAPELRLDRPSLGSLYLGGTSASQLARADVIQGEPNAITRADRLFMSAIAPWCPEVF
ncbi:MAG: GNAT family N-acetyltransferase [Kofleriaceae bacterium]